MRTKTRTATQFAVCIDNRGYPASLEVGKLYRVIPDEGASKHGVVDDSDGDYGFSAERFFVLKIPRPLALALRSYPGRPAQRPTNKALRATAYNTRRG